MIRNNRINKMDEYKIGKISGFIILLLGVGGVAIGLDTDAWKIAIEGVLFAITGLTLMCGSMLKELKKQIKKLENDKK